MTDGAAGDVDGYEVNPRASLSTEEAEGGADDFEEMVVGETVGFGGEELAVERGAGEQEFLWPHVRGSG